MFAMRLGRLAQHIVDSQFPHDNEGKALRIRFEVRMSDFSDGRDQTVYRDLELLFYAPAGGNYIAVFSKVTKLADSDRLAQYNFEGCHDSCWRDSADRVITQNYFDMANYLNESRAHNGLKEIAPKDFHTFADFPLATRGSLFDWVNVEVTKDPTDKYNHKRLIKVL